jgi:hypothetical protein
MVKPERQFKVGQQIQISLSGGKIEPAVVKAVVEQTEGTRLQVDFGHEQTALIVSPPPSFLAEGRALTPSGLSANRKSGLQYPLRW